MSEFELIRRYFAPLSYTSTAVVLGTGDDCALLQAAPDQQWVVSVDTLVAGRHFPVDAPAAAIASRALATAVSDLAAMGATPVAFTLALTLPAMDEVWLAAFSQGLAAAAAHYGMALIGGDTTCGPLTLSVQVHGQVPAGQALLRSGAGVGDEVYVSGALGDAALALRCMTDAGGFADAERDYLWQRFYRPQARIALGQRLRGIATAAIDISDGLLADAGHIASASKVAMTLRADELPLSAVLSARLGAEEAHELALTGGDDYELCFTAPKSQAAAIALLANELGVALTRVGVVSALNGSAQPTVTCLTSDGAVLNYDRQGYQHF